MNLDQKRLGYVVALTLLAVFFLPVLLQGWRLMVFAPLLVILYYKKTYLACLWWSVLCGAFLDLLAANAQFGFYAVNYGLTTLLLYGQRRNFFADNLSTLPLMTFFFSSLATLIQCVLIYAFEKENIFSWEWVMTDLIYMPTLDALYAFACFILPSLFLGKRRRRGKEYFLES